MIPPSVLRRFTDADRASRAGIRARTLTLSRVAHTPQRRVGGWSRWRLCSKGLYMSELRQMYKRMQLDRKSTRAVFGILKAFERFSGLEPFEPARTHRIVRSE
jgi:hypothetical protein